MVVIQRSDGVKWQTKYLEISTSSKELFLIIFLGVTLLPIPLLIVTNNITSLTLENSVVLVEIAVQDPGVLI